ncbi:glycosyltransferase family 8 [Haemophilus pittmaniae HK 85]|uniref:Glycosyltransferase family 8 n=2 Tax=Haemophilus pittmaniae TaxID=249188 RepID=F9Q675_9PAST|nr:glycosyltransferase family 8 [Haemophilus pittmaniae HK 85]SNV62841.1 1,4-alpha-galactosyltransferase (LgtC) [Haemophilus pittmaniae]
MPLKGSNMNIAFSSDNNYAPYLAISILSILKNNSYFKIYFYILDFGIEDDNRKIIEDIISKNGMNVRFIKVDKDSFSDFPLTISYISPATYARLNITKYIPNVDKLIYIDVDTLTNGPLDELWNTDIENYSLAACKDYFIEIDQVDYKPKIGLAEYSYFNAGVLLINMQRWRELNVLEVSLEWLAKYKDIIEYQDQDILNGIFKDDVKFINSRFNFTPAECGYIKYLKKRDIQFPAVIYHYPGPDKFWSIKSTHLKANLGYSLFKQICNNYPNFKAKFDEIDFKTKIKRLIKEIRYKLIYHIF